MLHNNQNTHCSLHTDSGLSLTVEVSFVAQSSLISCCPECKIPSKGRTPSHYYKNQSALIFLFSASLLLDSITLKLCLKSSMFSHSYASYLGTLDPYLSSPPRMRTLFEPNLRI